MQVFASKALQLVFPPSLCLILRWRRCRTIILLRLLVHRLLGAGGATTTCCTRASYRDSEKYRVPSIDLSTLVFPTVWLNIIVGKGVAFFVHVHRVYLQDMGRTISMFLKSLFLMTSRTSRA